MGRSILGTESVRIQIIRRSTGVTAALFGTTTLFALILIVALISIAIRAPARVAATVLAARTQSGG